MRTTINVINVIIVAAVLGLAGCAGLQEVGAWLTGAPSPSEVAAAKLDLKTAEAEARALQVAEAAAQAEADRLAAIAATEDAKKAQVRALYARMAAELANLAGAAADAMMETMGGLMRQLEAIDSNADAAAGLAAKYASEADKLHAARQSAALQIADAEANLDGLYDATEAAINATLATVGLAADSAASLGVPGAREVGATITKVGSGLLGTLLLGSTTWAGVRARRQGKRAVAAETRATNLGRVVSATERFGLLNLGPGADLEAAKQGAKEWAGSAAHHELKATLLANGNLASSTETLAAA